MYGKAAAVCFCKMICGGKCLMFYVSICDMRRRFDQGVKKTLEVIEEESYLPYIMSSDENDFLRGSLVASTHHLKVLGSYSEEVSAEDKFYDIHHDSRVDQVQLMISIMDLLGNRIKELLLEWSDHPTLKRVICERHDVTEGLTFLALILTRIFCCLDTIAGGKNPKLQRYGAFNEIPNWFGNVVGSDARMGSCCS